MEHLIDKLRDYQKREYYPYHMPGHKRREHGKFSEEILGIDITEIDDFDNLHQAEGILKTLQEHTAKLYGAEESYYLVNGSTSGILSAISAAVPYGGHILMVRNSHKSAYHAAYLRNLKISYLYPSFWEKYDIFDAITPQQIQEALEKEKDISAVFLVSPTYEGRIADIKSIAELVHQKGIPLIVDEAHGAHLGFAEGFSANSCQLGADIVIHSVHKTLPAMTQTALLHINGERIDRKRLQRFLRIYQTSSPSYVLMASIENALCVVENYGKKLFAEFLERYQNLIRDLEVCNCLEFVPFDFKKQDVGKLLISSKKFGLSGQQIYDILLKVYYLQLEMAAGSYCLAMFTIGDCEEAYIRMKKALLELDTQIALGMLKPQNKQFLPENPFQEKDVKMLSAKEKQQAFQKLSKRADSEENILRGTQKEWASREKDFLEKRTKERIPLAQAWDMPVEMVSLQEAVGFCVGDFINLYPPGVPILVPGEIMTKQDCRQIFHYLSIGLSVQGIERGENSYYVRIQKLGKETNFVDFV